jgi:inhibitor of cysteine peptidase
MTWILGLAATLLSGCASTPAPSTGAAITEKENGQTVALRVGQALEVRLPANPSTGYSWSQLDGDPAVLEPMGAATFEPQRQAPGAGGTSTMTYRAVGAGETVLKLIYHRPWERGVPPAKTFETRVVVK